MFTEKEKSLFNDWIVEAKKKNNTKSQYLTDDSEREIWLKNNPCPIADKLIRVYNEGYGYKTLAKELGSGYTTAKNFIMKIEGFEGRKGQNVVTDVLRKRRSENVKGEKSPWFDWPNRKPELLINNGKSINGYYLRKHDNQYVWLRSTYEYIYAKWLDKQNIIWKIEERVFGLSNGEKYRPDFFLYENEKLQCIVEIKSRYFNKGNREYKFDMFKKEYDIPCSIVTNIDLFIEKDKNYHKELKEWKTIRLLSLPVN